MPRRPVPLEDRSTRLLDARVRAFFHHLPRAVAGDEESVHQMRVAGRRVRVALPLLAKKPTGGPVRRARRTLRALIRAAASSRDLDVCLGLLDAAIPSRSAASRETRSIRRRLVAARRRGRRRMQDALLDQGLAGLRRDLRVVLRRRGEELPAVLGRLEALRDAGGAEILTLLREAGDRFDPEALHHLRTRVRRLRYGAEVDAEIRDVPAKAAKRLKALQEHLGAIHDAYVLATWLGRRAAGAENRVQVELAEEARRLEAAFLEESRARHRHHLGADPTGVVLAALARMGHPAPMPLRLAQ